MQLHNKILKKRQKKEMKLMETIDVIKKLLKDAADIDPEKVTADATMESLGLDSIDLAELVCNLEDELTIDFGNPTDLTTIGDVVSHVDSLR
jgi:acyl carrier protein